MDAERRQFNAERILFTVASYLGSLLCSAGQFILSSELNLLGGKYFLVDTGIQSDPEIYGI